MLVLKRKQLLERELGNLTNSTITLEQQTLSLESARTQQVAVAALRDAVVAQKIVNQQMNIDGIDNLMEQMVEQRDLQNDISNVLSQGCSIMDEDDLLRELNAMEADELDKKLLDAHGVPSGVPGDTSVQVSASASPARPVSVGSKLQGSAQGNAQGNASPLTSDEDQLRMLQAELS